MKSERQESDPLEARLRRTPLAPPPAAWRAEILAAAAEFGSASAASMALNRDEPREAWARLRALPGEWTAAAVLVLAVVVLNGSAVADLVCPGAPMTASRPKESSGKAVTVFMASQEALWRELGVEPRAWSPHPPDEIAPPPEPRRRQLNRTGTNDVVHGWA